MFTICTYARTHARAHTHTHTFTRARDLDFFTRSQNFVYEKAKSCEISNARVLRWRLKLAEYEYDVVYKAGKANVNADALSRNLVEITEIEDTAEIFPTCHEKKRKLTDEEIIKLLKSEDEDGCSNASIQGDDISQNFPTEEPEAYEENRKDALTKKQLTQNAIQNHEPVAGSSWKQDVPTRMITRSKAQPRKQILEVSEQVSGQDNNWDFSPMLDNDIVSQSDDSSDEDPEERRPVKKKKKNLPIVESDTEDSELESNNEIDSKKQNSDKKN